MEVLRMYLVNARQDKGYSMRKTARLAGMTYQHYSLVENGERGSRVSFMIMTRIAEALEMSLDTMKENEKAYQKQLENDTYY